MTGELGAKNQRQRGGAGRHVLCGLGTSFHRKEFQVKANQTKPAQGLKSEKSVNKVPHKKKVLEKTAENPLNPRSQKTWQGWDDPTVSQPGRHTGDNSGRGILVPDLESEPERFELKNGDDKTEKGERLPSHQRSIEGNTANIRDGKKGKCLGKAQWAEVGVTIR